MSVARLARSASTRSASTIRNVASERRSAPKISTTFAYAQRSTDQSFGVPLTLKGPCLLHSRDRKGGGRPGIAPGSVVLWEAVIYTRSARTIRRFWKVGIGVHVCNVTMFLYNPCDVLPGRRFSEHSVTMAGRSLGRGLRPWPVPTGYLSRTREHCIRLWSG